MKQGITKEQSSILQGIAILMMVFHHMFSDLSVYQNSLFFSHADMTLKAAWFCKICVGLFAFVSGYGICYVLSKNKEVLFLKRMMTDFSLIFRQLMKVYGKYWFIFLLFCIFSFGTGRILFQFSEFIGNFFGVLSTYQSTWWYMGQYALMMLLAPFIDLFFTTVLKEKQNTIRILFFAVLFVCVTLLFAGGYLFVPPLFSLCKKILDAMRIAFLLPYFVGYLSARFRIYDRLSRYYRPFMMSSFLTGTALLTAIICVRVKLATFPAYATIDFLLVPFFVHGMLLILSPIAFLRKFFAFFGKHSTYMWLIHGFLLSTCSEKITGLIHDPGVFYLMILGISLIFSMGIECACHSIRPLFNKRAQGLPQNSGQR